MRRAITTITGTVAVLVMLLSFKTAPRPVRTRPAALAPSTRSEDARPAARPGTPSAPQSPSRSTPSATQAAPKPATKTVATGQTVQTRYGPVQVRVTLSGGAIRDVQALQLPSDRRQSAAISDYAGPVLRQEVLAAQSAQIDTVSGATYTSDGYAQSLQSALDQAHVR